jgi:hypothetical protein
VFVEPDDDNLCQAVGFAEAVTGSTDRIAETLAGFTSVGMTRGKIFPYPNTIDTLERVIFRDESNRSHGLWLRHRRGTQRASGFAVSHRAGCQGSAGIHRGR